MKMILKSALAAAAMAGAAAAIPGPAMAGVGVSIGIGVPVLTTPVYSPYGPGYSPYEGQYYYDPIYIGGSWYHGPYRWRSERGGREFWVNGGWHRNEWRGGPVPQSIAFHNGGSFNGGRYDGFEGSDRINARFDTQSRGARGTHPEIKPAPVDVDRARQDVPDARRDAPRDRGDR
jgi:hypothetical protein